MGSSALTGRLGAMFRVQPGEGPRVALMIVYSAAAVGGVLTVGYNGLAVALFVSRLPASAVPFAFILPAISIVLTLLLYNRLSSRLWLPHLAAGSSVVLLLMGLLFRLLLATGYGRSFPVLAGLFLYCETSASLVIVQFWTFAGQIFNPREARRLFGLIAVGGILSNVVAGLALAALVQFIGVENLLFIVVGALAVCTVCATALSRHVRPPDAPRHLSPEPARSSQRQSLFQDLRAIRRSPLLLAIAGLTVLLSLLINTGGYQFLLVTQIAYAGRSQDLTVFLGAFAFWTGLAALGVQLYLTGRVMTRFGIFTALLFYPLGMALTGVFGLLTGGALWAMTLNRAADPVFRRTINDSALNTLYLPAPPDLRQRAKPLLEGTYALSFGLAGVVFLLMRWVPGWTYVDWSVPVLVLAVCWIVLLFWGRRQYVTALAESVSRRRLDFGQVTLDIADETTAGVLVHALQSADDLQVVHVLQLIADAPGTTWVRHVAPLLEHHSPHVRIMALRYLERDRTAAYAQPVAALLQAPEDDVRAAALSALCAIAGSDAPGHVTPFIDDPSPRVKGAAVASLMTYGGREGNLLAARSLKGMVEDDDPAVRREAAHVLGALAGQTFDSSVMSLLGDSSTARLSALQAPAVQHGRVLVAHLARLLEDKATMAAAADGLVRHSAESLPAMSELLGNRTYSPAVRTQAARILQRIGGPVAAEILLGRLSEPDEMIRSAVCRALAQLRAAGMDFRANEAIAKAAILTEIHSHFGLYVLREELNAGGEDPLLSDTLRERMGQTLDRVFFLLEVCYPGHKLERARQALDTPEGNTRSMAIELLDTVLERQLKDPLIALLEAPAERVVEIARIQLSIPLRFPADRLGELAESADPWLRACAIYRIGTLRISHLTTRVKAGLESDDSLVCEVALAACRHLLEPAELAQLLIAQAAGARFPNVRRYAEVLLQDMKVA